MGGIIEDFDGVVAEHRSAMYRVARRFTGSHADADEATQQALVRAWKARESFRGEANLRTWLIRIVINVAKSMHRAKRPTESLEAAAEIADAGPVADDALGLARSRARVRAAVEKLPNRQRSVVLLKVFSDMTHKEVAAALSLSEGAVKAHLHQAVANLRRALRVGEGVTG